MTKDELKQKVEFDGFSEEEMVSFGNFLLSKERRQSYKSRKVKGFSLSQRLSQVHHADLENFKQTLI